MGRPADVAILRECLNRDHVVNPSHTSSRPSSVVLLHPLHDRVLFPGESCAHPLVYVCTYLHVRHRFLLSFRDASLFAEDISPTIGIVALTRKINERTRISC